jgi:hypothetical protein
MRRGRGSYKSGAEIPQACGCTADMTADAQSSRRTFLKAGATLVTGGAVGQIPASAHAQGVGATDPDAELRRLRAQRRILGRRRRRTTRWARN